VEATTSAVSRQRGCAGGSGTADHRAVDPSCVSFHRAGRNHRLSTRWGAVPL